MLMAVFAACCEEMSMSAELRSWVDSGSNLGQTTKAQEGPVEC